MAELLTFKIGRGFEHYNNVAGCPNKGLSANVTTRERSDHMLQNENTTSSPYTV